MESLVYATAQLMQQHGGPSKGGAGAESALAQAASHLSRIVLANFPNGVVVFATATFSEVLHPFHALSRQIFVCGEEFDTSLLDEAIQIRKQLTYGVVVVDGHEATLGVAQAAELRSSTCSSVIVLSHLSSNIASRTRRGGSSAARYARNRDGEELAFLRKVAQKARDMLGTTRAVIVGGKADMKRNLVRELPSSLRVARIVDIGCSAGLEGLRSVAEHVQDVFKIDCEQGREDAVRHFLESMAQTDAQSEPMVCYGEIETEAAIRLGGVDQLLVGSTSLRRGNRTWDEWRALADDFGTSIVLVHPTSDLGQCFCEGFGVGACLRYPMDSALFDVFPLDECSEINVGVDEPGVVQKTASDCESASTAESKPESYLLEWLQGALRKVLKDDSLAESLTVCAEVVLFREGCLVDQESLDTTLEMLREEGVPDSVVVEFRCHVCDLVYPAQF